MVRPRQPVLSAMDDHYPPVSSCSSVTDVTAVCHVLVVPSLRGFDMDAIAPLYMNEIQRQIVDGMATEDLILPDTVRDSLDEYPEKCMEACASGNLAIQLHDDLPFGLALFDDRVGIGVREPAGRQLRVFVDTDSAAVREWAEAVYEAYETEAIPMAEYSHECFRETMERGELGLRS